MGQKRRCPVCQSKKWHKEPSSGLIVCSEGHVMQNYRNEAADEEAGHHALRKRTLKANRTAKDKSRINPKLYHGARGQFHYYQCQQLILRHQIAALVKECALPPEFELVCRDIWALHLSLLPNPPPPEPYYHSQSLHTQQKHGSSAGPDNHSSDEATADEPGFVVSKQVEHMEEPELEELLRENSEASSTSEDEDSSYRQQGDVEEGLDRGKGRNGVQGRHTYEGLQGTLSVLVLALLASRIPVMYTDIIRRVDLHMIEAYKLPYLEGLRLLPHEMTLHLTKHNLQSLSPAHAPHVLGLHALVSRLAKQLNATYKVLTPEVNGGPLLWRVVRRIGGTPMLYTLTKRLGEFLTLPLLSHYSLSSELARVTKGYPESHKYDTVPPELAFAATTIIVLKMVYGLDGSERVPPDGDDPASWLPRLDDFIDALKVIEVTEEETPEHLFSTSSPMPVSDLSDEMLDKYLDFCERSLIGGRVGAELDQLEGGEAVLNRFFPLSSRHTNERESSNSRAEHRGGDLRANLPSPFVSSTHEDEQKSLQPAEAYTIYHSRDVFGSMGEEIELIVERVGKVVGIPSEYVLSVMETYERRIARRWKQKRIKSQEGRLRGGGQDEELILDDDDD